MSITNSITPIQPVADKQTPSVQKAGSQTLATHAVVVKKITHSADDRAELSLTGRTVATALQTSDVRTEKVASLQQAIASGTYKVSSSDVAGKLIQSLQTSTR